MDITTSLLDVLNFDPVLLGVFAGLAMLYVQALKPILAFARNNPQILILGFTFFFSILITFEVLWALKILVIMYLLMIGSAGLYNGAKNQDAAENPKGI